MLEMLDQIRSIVALESSPNTPPPAFGHTVQQFRFLPESYLAAVGTELDPGLDHLVYLRMFVEDEAEDAVQ